jgi:hypothetical protein
VTHRFHRMQKHKFSVTCPEVLFVEFIPVPHEDEKLCVDVSRPESTRMHYVTHRTHRMQKQMFGVTCPSALYVESVPVLLENKK